MAETSLGLDENVEAALSYLLGFLTGILFYLLESDNEFVKFHAAQSIVLFGGLFILNTALGMVTGSLFVASPMAGMAVAGLLGLVSTLISLIALVLWILLMVKAYQGERYSIPVIGGFAEGIAE